ncbi:BgTH12-01737 [Blumeria graminis f. sp. triticale]|uniref:BgTH12-01737 n=1 Tax=Blumeria graminis f. sp. triticale TaxID=1689686 RepID=A0A9W4GF42_BLUGR|nr:BgTH12-01737 [Blumeria graminis f. sp. triticale]
MQRWKDGCPVDEISTMVLLFPHEEPDAVAKGSSLHRVAKQVSPSFSYADKLTAEIVNLSNRNVPYGHAINGFLYVPDLSNENNCTDIAEPHIPANATRRASLPPSDYTLIAVAPWLSAKCTLSLMKAASMSPTRGFIFYLPNGGLEKSPSSSSIVWDLGDNEAWKDTFQFPVYAIPTIIGAQLMTQLGLYSGNVTEVPHGYEIAGTTGTDPRDYVRLYTEIKIANDNRLPRFWALQIFTMLVVVSGGVTLLIYLMQNSHQKSLRRKIKSGKVNLGASRFKCLRVPASDIEKLPLFTYYLDKKEAQLSTNSIPTSISSPIDKESLAYPLQPLVYVITTMTHRSESFPYKRFLPHHQPICAFCFGAFRSGISQVRELPCHHIFHPTCIDSYLNSCSSLCPICKQSALSLASYQVEAANVNVYPERVSISR